MAEQPSRPRRVRLPDFAGRSLSLPDGLEAWENMGGDACGAVLLLGLGPGSPWLTSPAARAETVFWLDAPDSLAALNVWHEQNGAARPAPPAHWRAVTPEAAVALAPHCRGCFYRPGLRLAPGFWGPLLGRVEVALAAAPGAPAGGRMPPGRRAALLPGNGRQLLHMELRRALEASGFGPVLEGPPQEILRVRGTASLLLSVNLRGLDGDGRVFYACRARNVPVALWFVDNPWHVLSGVRLPWWREAHIFVTDAGFIPGLRAAGAESVAHLPLAVAPHMWREADRRLPDLAGPPLFVGRSAFPDKQKFFAAARAPESLMEKATVLLARSRGPADAPHFFWWLDRLAARAWPGRAARDAGLGAENCSQANRARWLKAALDALGGRLALVGDDGWRTLLPGARPEPPVDYYASLPERYAGAGAVLNVTSLLLPHSLSQRHFDVWAAGGLLLSDATAGLDIFPSNLTRPVTLDGPEDFAPRLAALRDRAGFCRDLRAACREHLSGAHRYEHRVARICEAAGL